jgi:hypothetical protein
MVKKSVKLFVAKPLLPSSAVRVLRVHLAETGHARDANVVSN